MITVLDSWAVLGYLQDESPGAAHLNQLFEHERPVMSWMNLGEVFYILKRRHGEADASETVRDLRDRVIPDMPTPDRVIEAARIKADHPMAYADAFAAATAIATGGVLWTGDPELLIDGAAWRWADLRLANYPVTAGSPV